MIVGDEIWVPSVGNIVCYAGSTKGPIAVNDSRRQDVTSEHIKVDRWLLTVVHPRQECTTKAVGTYGRIVRCPGRVGERISRIADLQPDERPTRIRLAFQKNPLP